MSNRNNELKDTTTEQKKTRGKNSYFLNESILIPLHVVN